MDIWNKMRILLTVKAIHTGIATILLGFALLLSIGFYYFVLEYKLSERRFEVTSIAVHTNIDQIRLYRDVIRQTNLANKSDEEKVLALNATIQPLFNEISKKYPNYDIYLDSRVARDPSDLEVIENNTSFGWNRKGKISVTVPFNVDNIVSGQVWVIKTDDIYQRVLEYTIGFLGLLLVLFFIPYILTWFMIKRLKACSQQIRTYEAILQHASDAISTIDLDFKITSLNLAGQKMYGYTATEMIGCEYTSLTLSEGFQKSKEDFKRVIAGEILSHCVKRKKKDGKVIEVFLITAPIRDDKDHIIGIMGIGRDVTESKRIETEMKRLDGLNTIGQMAASIAHEVRNPMTTVRGFLQMLGAKPYFLDYKDYFELMIEELDRANSIITEFLSLSRNKPIALSVQSLNTIITKLLPLLQADALRNEHNIMVKLEETPDIEMNEPEIRQVILNLARNGFESMSAGGVLMINVYLEKNQVVMTFRDQGSGIPPEVFENVGKPFLTTKDKGTGLGLTVSYNIVYRHAGTISIETGTEGTTFKVKLPISHATCLG